MEVLIIVVAVLAVVGVGFALLRSPHPEDISGHADEAEPDSPSEQRYGYAERPAGPDAEGMGVAGAGEIVTGGEGDASGPEDR
jgi:hypothetical protein